mmetsp:Transcript_26494/g.86949  ORF Transcript_26494/g.86949 Transcript_26494/m.86949 type:complete len:214 (-) Transcript_26494:989-1630(-)
MRDEHRDVVWPASAPEDVVILCEDRKGRVDALVEGELLGARRDGIRQLLRRRARARPLYQVLYRVEQRLLVHVVEEAVGREHEDVARPHGHTHQGGVLRGSHRTPHASPQASSRSDVPWPAQATVLRRLEAVVRRVPRVGRPAELVRRVEGAELLRRPEGNVQLPAGGSDAGGGVESAEGGLDHRARPRLPAQQKEARVADVCRAELCLVRVE